MPLMLGNTIDDINSLRMLLLELQLKLPSSSFFASASLNQDCIDGAPGDDVYHALFKIFCFPLMLTLYYIAGCSNMAWREYNNSQKRSEFEEVISKMKLYLKDVSFGKKFMTFQQTNISFFFENNLLTNHTQKDQDEVFTEKSLLIPKRQ